MYYRLIKFLINRPKIVFLLLLFICGLAFSSLLNLKRLSYPRIDFERMFVTTIYPGASPEDVELNVTIKLEEALKEVDGIDYYTSRSMEGVSSIRVTVDPENEDPEKVKGEIRRAVEGVSDLPEEVQDRPNIFEAKVDNWSIYEVALVMDGANERLLRTHARRLKRRFKDLEVITRVWETGVRDREFRILIDQRKMDRKQVSFKEVLNAIKSSKVRISGGQLESFTSEKGIVTFSDFESPKEIERIIVRSNEIGEPIRVRDLGTVVDSFAKKNLIIRFNGKVGVSLYFSKKGSADVIRAVEKIKEVVEKYKEENAPEGMRFLSTFDASIETKKRLSILYQNAAFGFMLVLFILFFFLERRIAFWTAMGIPVSVAVAIICLPMIGVTINSVSLCGFIVVLGMVVDDAIIVGESIYREMKNGASARDAAILGLQRVVKPVLGTIVSTMIAFLPIYYIPGVIGKFATEIPTVVIVVLAASFIEATLLLPIHLGSGGNGKKRNLGEGRLGDRLFDRAEKKYRKLLQWVVLHKYKASMVFLAFLFLGATAGSQLTRFNMFPIDQSNTIWLTGKTLRDSSLPFTAKAVGRLEKIIESLPDGIIHSYKATIGQAALFRAGRCSNCFFMKLILTPSTDREMSAVDVRDLIKKRFEEIPDGPIKKIAFSIEGGGPRVGKPIEIEVIGNDNGKRKEIIDIISEEIEKFHVTDIDTNYQKGKPEIRIIPDHEAIAASGLTVLDIASTIRTAVDGTIVSYLHTPEDKIPFRVLMDPKFMDFDRPMKGLKVPDGRGHLISLERLVKTKKAESALSIFHYNSDRTNSITGSVDLKKTDPKTVYEELKEKYRNFEDRFPGFRIKLKGEAEKSASVYKRMIILLMLTVLAIFLLLVVQFDSFTQPAMVILAIPFGLVGVTLAFGLHGTDLSLMALIGILGFSGVVVNDSLIMVDYINRLKREGVDDFLTAVLDGAKMRLRPIVLTTLTTVAGLLPTAYGLIGGYDHFIAPMVLAMAWGLMIGTSSILFVIPVFYLIHRDLLMAFKKRFPKLAVSFD